MSILSSTKHFRLFAILFSLIFSSCIKPEKSKVDLKSKSEPFVVKHVLPNGLTVLVRKVDTLQKVAVELWYGVGSKHEGTGEKGIAHLIEHMLMKGTEKMSESDMQLLGDKLSMYWNAWTSQDFTTMKFCLPISQWQQALPILADCMCNCTFDQDLLNSELKVVVQELKMYRDDVSDTLRQEMMAALFSDHPYHYPIIGHKHDLFNVSAETLKSFYKKHYVPNNATLVVVGKVDPADVISQAVKNFGSIPASRDYQKKEFYHNRDLRSQSITLYRDIKKPVVSLAFSVPGLCKKSSYVSRIICDILGADKMGRLSKRLVDDLKLLDSIYCGELAMIDHSLLTISFELMVPDSLDQIVSVIQEELKALAINGCLLDDLRSFINITEVEKYSLLENNSDQADLIGQTYVATGDENYLFTQTISDPETLNKKIKEFAATYLRPSVMHKGVVYPLPDDEKSQWLQLQQESDEADARILHGKVRHSDVGPGKYVHQVPVCEPCIPQCPQPKTFTLKNGIKVLYYHTSHIPMVSLIVDLKSTIDHEPASQPGIYKCLRGMLQESGTANKSAEELTREFAQYGISYHSAMWSWSAKMMNKDLPKACDLISEILTKPNFTQSTLAKIKPWLESYYKSFWDSEKSIASLMQNQEIFNNHPQGRFHLANFEQIKNITLDDVNRIYKQTISPDGAIISIVGNIPQSELPQLKATLEKTFGQWRGQKIAELEYPQISPTAPVTHTHYMNRDQVVIGFGGISRDCLHEDYDALSLYEANLHSRLFELRVKSGAFYWIAGSVCNGSSKQPGSWKILTIASTNRLAEVEDLVRAFIKNDIEAFDEEDLAEAKRALLISAEQHYTSNDAIASTFLALHDLGLPFDHYQHRCAKLCKITADDVKRAVKKVLNTQNMCTVLVGRVGEPVPSNSLSPKPVL